MGSAVSAVQQSFPPKPKGADDIPDLTIKVFLVTAMSKTIRVRLCAQRRARLYVVTLVSERKLSRCVFEDLADRCWRV